ncbi:hypothetical protein N0V83_002344 [Neocucurbitaria cava]|uniref:IgE-binding protein n=1 Tax=Neocucurbitaria cava TaxID=798079 RepID=A0A9W8YF23_9PLEO|nr:hypothetical protein N0V83_002344 [Neocucurbitaria cava]
MKSTLAFMTLLATALAQSSCTAEPAPSATATAVPNPYTPGYFGVISARSASPIHLLSLTARGGKFYLGGPGPSSYCPVEVVGDACPPGNYTVLAGGDKTLAMGVVVPGGQQAYVAPDGSLSYTQAHSAYIPTDSIIDQFSVDAPEDGQAFGYLHFETGFVACPAGEGQGYQVFGQVSNAIFGPDCLGFSALTVATDEPGAWQY